MKTRQQILAALLCRLAELRLPPHSHKKRVLKSELRTLVAWIRGEK